MSLWKAAIMPALEGANGPRGGQCRARKTQKTDGGAQLRSWGTRQAVPGKGLVEPEKGQESHQGTGAIYPRLQTVIKYLQYSARGFTCL